MSLQGSCLSFPVAPDNRGTLAIVNDPHAIIEQSIASIIETSQGSRVMMPDYGIPDFVFSVMDAGFGARIAYFVEQQIQKYEPLVGSVKVTAASSTKTIDEPSLYRFMPDSSFEENRVVLNVTYTERGSNTVRNLVFPMWELK